MLALKAIPSTGQAKRSQSITRTIFRDKTGLREVAAVGSEGTAEGITHRPVKAGIRTLIPRAAFSVQCQAVGKVPPLPGVMLAGRVS